MNAFLPILKAYIQNAQVAISLNVYIHINISIFKTLEQSMKYMEGEINAWFLRVEEKERCRFICLIRFSSN